MRLLLPRSRPAQRLPMPLPRLPAPPMPPKDPKAAARKRRYYQRKKKDPAWKAKHNRRSREGMQRLWEARAWRAIPRKPTPPPEPEEELSIVSAAQLRSPTLKYLDAAGVLHVEEELSAEELIARWKKEQKKK